MYSEELKEELANSSSQDLNRTPIIVVFSFAEYPHLMEIYLRSQVEGYIVEIPPDYIANISRSFL